MCLGVAGGMLSPKSRPDPAPASRHPSTGCLPKEPMGQPGLEAGETAGAVPASPPPRGGTRPPWLLQTVELFAFLALLKPDLQPGLRDALLRGAVTLNILGNRHHRAPSSGSAVPTLLSPSPTSTYAVVKCSTHRAPAQFPGGAAGAVAAAVAAAAIYSR